MLNNSRAQATTELAVLGALIIAVFSFLISYSEKLNRQQSYLQQTFRAALKEARNANNSASYTKVAFRRMSNVSSPMELGQLQSFSNSSSVLWANGKGFQKEDGKDASGATQYRDVPGVVKYQLNEDTAIDIPQSETLHNLKLDLVKAGVDSAITDGISGIENALAQDNPDYPAQAEKLKGYISQLESSGASVDTITALNKILASLSGGATQTDNNTFTNTTDSTTKFIKQKSLSGDVITTKILNATDTLQADVSIDGNNYSFKHYLGSDGKYYPTQTTLERSRNMQ